jgi:hypothetical protein
MRLKGFAPALAGVMALYAFGGSPAALAQKAARGAPAKEAVETEDPSKFFLFHLEGISMAGARADLSYCISQSRPILSMRDRNPSGGGLIGALINGRMAEIDRFRMRTAAMRKCMGLLGYARYQVPSAQWKVMVKEGDIVVDNKGNIDPEVVDRMAAFASGPTPSGPRLDP